MVFEKGRRYDQEAKEVANRKKVITVQIGISPDLSPLTFFKIEEILREHEIHYRVMISEPARSKKKEIQLYETDGVARGKVVHATGE
ncbi:MAG: hypothetical protein ACI9E1_000354 [Cryomorphaceae bacterium]|jgi:hypothetical protein